MEDMGILDTINGPQDLKKLPVSSLRDLAREIRELVSGVVGKNGGHLASNLGVVELTIALHRVFSSPDDSIIWDVGHQCYAHKILTGRYGEFGTIRKKDGLSGFPKRTESPHDKFDTGHASTSISAALGILAASRMSGSEAKSIAVIGDGALTCGMAFEALEHAGHLGLPLIIVLNDNKMSISPNVGALSRYLSRLSGSVKYQRIRKAIDKTVLGTPIIGKALYKTLGKMKRSLKALLFSENLFYGFGFEYVGPIDGHDIPLLASVLAEARDIDRPIVVHVITKKGKGVAFAENDPARYHGVQPVKISDGKVETRGASTYTEAFSDALMSAAARDPKIVAITAAMEKGTGLSPFAKMYPKRFFDVGIAEEHAVTFAAGLAAGGLKPVVALYSTFIQRSVDQVFHDVALQNLPVVFMLDRSGPVADDGETHQGLWDIALLRSFPNIQILAPASAADLERAFEYALSREGPTVIRYPKALCPPETAAFSEPYGAFKGVFASRFGKTSDGRKKRVSILAIAMGGLVAEALRASDSLARAGVELDVYNMRFISPADDAGLADIASEYGTVLLLEEGVVDGGACAAAALGLKSRLPGIDIRVWGFDSVPLGQCSREEALEEMGLSADALRDRITEIATAKSGSSQKTPDAFAKSAFPRKRDGEH